LEFTLNYWMEDPENGQQNLRSRINLAILQSLRANGIEIPYPQRVIHTVAAAPVPASPPDAVAKAAAAVPEISGP
ncbi:MAG: mechanosensitive ion channel protein, partial [Polaromonas sp.]|nr:mechanosensitive ion channel protein [Polaromonas sp.]